MEIRNVFLYWVGKEYTLINILRKLIYAYSTYGKGYKVHLITEKNIGNYIQNIPKYFNKLSPTFQSHFVRVSVICDYGGIWLDSDTIILDTLDTLFEYIENKSGFLIKYDNTNLGNVIFGSKKQTPLMLEWKNKIIEILDIKKGIIGWFEIGNDLLNTIYNSNIYNDYEIINGLDTIYPVFWMKCVAEFIDKPYENYKNIIRNFQPLVILVNSVYKNLRNKTEEEILNSNMPINYFINKSLENINIKNYNDLINIDYTLQEPVQVTNQEPVQVTNQVPAPVQVTNQEPVQVTNQVQEPVPVTNQVPAPVQLLKKPNNLSKKTLLKLRH